MEENQIIDPVVQAFNAGSVFAYPTEAVMGLGCDPMNQQAVEEILNLKNRPVEKGMILIAKDYSQLLPYVNDASIPMDRRTEIFSSWPGPVTWLLPKSSLAPGWITGVSESIAVRVSAHPVVVELCGKVNSAVVSTSANLAGGVPAKNRQEANALFGDKIFYIDGDVGGNANPSIIRNGMNGDVIRAG